MSNQTNTPEVVDISNAQIRSKPFLKSGSYGIRCISCEKGTSKKGNPMLTFQYEIVSPATIKDVNPETGVEEDRAIAGLKLTDWVVLNDIGFPKLKVLHQKHNLPMQINVQTPNTKQYVGKAFNVALRTEPRVILDENTKEPMLDDKNQPISTNDYRIVRVNSADMEHTIPADAVAF